MQKIQAFIDGKLSEGLEAQKNNLFLWVPFCFSVGIAIYFSLIFEPALWVGTFLSFIGLIASVGLYYYRKYNDTPLSQIMFLVILGGSFCALGFTVAQLRTYHVYTPMLLKKLSPVSVEGVIENIEWLGERDGSRVILTDVKIERLKDDETPRKIRIKIRKDDGLSAGQHIRVLAGLNPASPPVAPNAFDFQRMAFFKGIGAVGFAYGAAEILSGAGQKLSPPFLTTLREKIVGRIGASVKATQQPVIIALMTGQRGAISDNDWDALRGSGLAHLLAISGLHVGMIAGVLFFFSRLLFACVPYLALHYPIKKWAAVIALIGAFFYTLIVGATVPTQRALIMTSVVMLAIIMDRSPFSLRLVALAAIVVLFFSPESLTSVSFQMSFAAVVSLIYFYNLIRPYWRSFYSQAGFFKKATLYFVGVSLTTIVAGVATGLFSLYHFQNYAVYGVIANLVAVPLMGFVVMPFIVMAYLLMPFGLDFFVFPVIDWGVGWVLASAHWVHGMEGALWHVPSWPSWIFILMVCCGWFWIVLEGHFKRILIPIFICLISFIFIYKQPDILISSKINLISIRDDKGSLWFSTGRAERYTADNWMRSNGTENARKKIWPKEGGAEGFPLQCDYHGCLGEVKGYKILIAFHQKAWEEDCRWADIVISQKPIPYKGCQDAMHVIDYFDVWEKGGHAIWLGKIPLIKTVEGERGQRPWTQIPANKTK